MCSRVARRSILVVMFLAAACVLGGAAAGSGAKPVIGRPVAAPSQPRPGGRFSVAFHVRHARSVAFSDTLAGARLRHVDSFHAGIARTTVVVPAAATGALHVRLTARWGAATTTRQASFAIRVAALPSLSVEDASAAEGTSGTTPMVFQVTLSAASAKSVSVGYATSDGTATAPADYVATSGTLTLSPGETTKTITVPIVGSQSIAPNKQFSLNLVNPVNATLLSDTATGNIETHTAPNQGSWQGATQEGNYVYFTVTPAGAITQFRTNSLTESCNGGLELSAGVSWGSQEWTIGSDGTVTAGYSGAGPPSSDGVVYTAETWKLTGTFTTATMSGTLALADDLTYQGNSYSCSGSVTFTATFRG